MTQKITSWLVALYVLLCIVLGGSAQNPWLNLALQLVGIALLAAAAILSPTAGRGPQAAAVNLLLVCATILILLQLIPLPPQIWTNLPGRGDIAASLHMLGYPIGSAPISEMPFQSILTLFAAIPAIAAFAITERQAASGQAVAAAIVGGMIASIFLGAIQVAGGADSWSYFYAIHSGGAIGFFANGNHMGTLLLAGIPMAAALIVSAKGKREMSSWAQYGLGAALFVLILVGIILNGSRAALGLSVPVLLASVALFPRAIRWRGLALSASALALVAGLAVIASMPMTTKEFSQTSSSAGDRRAVWAKTADAIGANFPVGTGLGTFEIVYHRYEDPAQPTTSFINHAHNEYLELALELGAGGILLIALFLAWWALAAARIWSSAQGTIFGRAATITTAAILAHSAVDFPLRTGAISVIFAVCIALMAKDLQPFYADDRGTRRTVRHVKLG